MSKKNTIIIVVGAVVSVLLVVLAFVGAGGKGSFNSVENTIDTSGSQDILVMPNVAVESAPWDVPVYNEKSTETSKVLRVPIVPEPCPIEATGVIGAPDDYTKACRFKIGSAEAIISHAVRGSDGRFGVFQHLDQLDVGETVNLDNKVYEVSKVDIVDNKNLPKELFEDNKKLLITCTLMEQHKTDANAPWTHNTVVTLEEV